MTVDIDVLNKDIDKLQKLRSEYFDQQLKNNKDELFKLEWLKDVDLYFSEMIGAYGNLEYHLRGIFPYKYKSIHFSDKLIGNSSHYQDNIWLRCSFDPVGGFEIFSSNHKLFAKFVEQYVGEGKISSYINFSDKIGVYQVLQKKGR